MFALTRRCDDVRRRKDAKLCDVQFVKNDLPGLRPKAREDENVEFGKYENIDRLRPKRRNAKGVLTPAPRKDSAKLVRSPLSPDYINRTVTRSAQGLPTPSKSNSLQELAGIVAMSKRGQGDITSALESWARKISDRAEYMAASTGSARKY